MSFYFLNVILVSLPAHYLLIITSAIFRAHRKVWVPLCSIIIAFGVNVFGDFGFGLGYFGLPKMGYAGIAWSTFFSVSAAALFNIIMLIKFKLIGRKSFVRWRWIKAGSPYLIKISIFYFVDGRNLGDRKRGKKEAIFGASLSPFSRAISRFSNH